MKEELVLKSKILIKDENEICYLQNTSLKEKDTDILFFHYLELAKNRNLLYKETAIFYLIFNNCQKDHLDNINQ